MTNTLRNNEQPLAVRAVFCHKRRCPPVLETPNGHLSNTDYGAVDMPMPSNGTSVRARKARKPISTRRRFEIFKRDGFTCQYCGAMPPKAVLHVDHIIPVAEGGGNDEGNLTTACSLCNGGKSAVPLNKVPQSLKERAAQVAEAEAQLRGLAEVLAAQRERVEGDVWTVIHALYGDDVDEVRREIFQSCKTFVERLPLHDVLEAADIALAKVNGRAIRPRAFFPYFCGVCWRKIKGDA